MQEAQRLLEPLPPELCASCVGRAFAHGDVPGASNVERGLSLRGEAAPPSPECPGCEGIPGRLDAYATLCLDASRPYEFDTFLVGSVHWPEIRGREDALYERLATLFPEHRRTPDPDGRKAPAFAPAEYLKAEINRELGKRIEAATGKRVDFSRPDLTFHVDARLDHVRLQVASVYVKGRYRKHERTLPQTRWPCRACGGMGCRQCEYRGKKYDHSVEEWIAAPFVEAADAPGEAFHGMGREDIDARMLGDGRPFVLELKAPKKRRLDWPRLAAEVVRRSGGAVEALDVAPAEPGAVAEYKAADPDKTYRARCVAATTIDAGMLISVMPSFRGVRLDQRTPERVAHRRADLIRERRVHDVQLLRHEGSRFELEIRAESGTYIKEFVSGDDGRTRPSLAATLGVPVKVEELDVIDVAWKE